MNTTASDDAAGHFQNAASEHRAAELGMWIFLATELMFFGPLLLSYALGRVHFSTGFAMASNHTDVLIGTMNTAILLTSSLCMALAVHAIKLRNATRSKQLLWITATLGTVFLGLKATEYYHEWQQHLVPWLDFKFDPAHQHAASYFFFLYFAMTGVHALHLSIGIIMISVLAFRLRVTATDRLSTITEMSGLYWHFVDAIWVLLYPILYLVGHRS